MLFCFFFNEPAPPEIYTLSLHYALPICPRRCPRGAPPSRPRRPRPAAPTRAARGRPGGDRSAGPERAGRRSARRRRRSEEHTSELQSRQYLVCRLLLEKKKSIVPE